MGFGWRCQIINFTSVLVTVLHFPDVAGTSRTDSASKQGTLPSTKMRFLASCRHERHPLAVPMTWDAAMARRETTPTASQSTGDVRHCESAKPEIQTSCVMSAFAGLWHFEAHCNNVLSAHCTVLQNSSQPMMQ